MKSQLSKQAMLSSAEKKKMMFSNTPVVVETIEE
jgi:hypothetical protein